MCKDTCKCGGVCPPKKMTRSDVLAKIKEHFSKPGAVFGVVYDDGPYCVYRGMNDPSSSVRCAFGVLIPDKLYAPEWENTLAEAVFLELSYLFAADVGADFINACQEAHDNEAQQESPSIEVFLDSLDAVGLLYGSA